MNTVRIISGEYKGRAIGTPKNGTHPMGERERLALFNMLQQELAGKNVLDAFSGSGAIGIEALSRGTRKVVFVEKNRDACKVIRENCQKLDIKPEKYEIECLDVYKFLLESKEKFDIIIADPPYDDYKNVALPIQNVAKSDSVFMLSHPDDFAPVIPGFKLFKTKKYARAHISFYLSEAR